MAAALLPRNCWLWKLPKNDHWYYFLRPHFKLQCKNLQTLSCWSKGLTCLFILKIKGFVLHSAWNRSKMAWLGLAWLDLWSAIEHAIFIYVTSGWLVICRQTFETMHHHQLRLSCLSISATEQTHQLFMSRVWCIFRA